MYKFCYLALIQKSCTSVQLSRSPGLETSLAFIFVFANSECSDKTNKMIVLSESSSVASAGKWTIFTRFIKTADNFVQVTI